MLLNIFPTEAQKTAFMNMRNNWGITALHNACLRGWSMVPKVKGLLDIPDEATAEARAEDASIPDPRDTEQGGLRVNVKTTKRIRCESTWIIL